jgi:hypothetical protein
MLEHCARCQAYAPEWDDPDYADWHIVVTPDGEYLGVVCTACHIDDELTFAGVAETAPPARPVDDLADRRRVARRRREARRTSRRAA